jgi:N-methylhydantoinase B
VRERTCEPWADGSPHPIGQRAHAGGDGGSSLMQVAESATRLATVEAWEARNLWLVELAELATDSGGPGRYHWRARSRHQFPSTRGRLRDHDDRARTAPWGWRVAAMGGRTRPFSSSVTRPAGRGKGEQGLAAHGIGARASDGWAAAAASVPAKRDAAALAADLREGYVSEIEARRCYPEALTRASPFALTSTGSPVRSAR